MAATVLFVLLPTVAAQETPKKDWPSLDGQESVAEYAKRAGLAAAVSLDLGAGVALEFVLVPAGNFMMGGSEDPRFSWDVSNKPIHRVSLTAPFYIGKYEVTVGQFRRFAETSNYLTGPEKAGKGSTLKDGKWQMLPGACWKETGLPQTPKHPVGLVTWFDAAAFAKWVSRQTGREVSLPTEAQWEYAARGPKSLEHPWGNAWDPKRCNHADLVLKKTGFKLNWPIGPEDEDGFAAPAPVGSYPSGASWCGALDLAGNVWEWCRDFSGNYPVGEAVDPQGPPQAKERILRGASIDGPPRQCRGAVRLQAPGGYSQTDVGFRVVLACSLDAAPTK